MRARDGVSQVDDDRRVQVAVAGVREGRDADLLLTADQLDGRDMSASRAIGTATSDETRRPSADSARPVTRQASRRISPSASSTLRAPAARQVGRPHRTCARADGPMNCPTRTAAAPSVLSPVGWCFSTASTLGRSIGSITSGTTVVRMTAVTASCAGQVGNTARNVTVSPVGHGTSAEPSRGHDTERPSTRRTTAEGHSRRRLPSGRRSG